MLSDKPVTADTETREVKGLPVSGLKSARIECWSPDEGVMQARDASGRVYFGVGVTYTGAFRSLQGEQYT